MKISSLALLISSLLTNPSQTFASPPKLMLADSYTFSNSSKSLEQYYVSEKLDGVRAYWNGKELVTRGGKVLNPPKRFIDELPHHALDGELWAGRGQFHVVQQTVLDQNPDDALWEKVRFMVFDVPSFKGSFNDRYAELVLITEQSQNSYLHLVEHENVADERALALKLEQIESLNGEGLMLRKKNSLYRVDRSDDLLKVKSFQDSEAVVVGYTEGKGKYQSLVGALLVKNEQGKEFKIGSGLSLEDRKNPPVLGSVITYRFNGYTHNGLPRFARYVRVRAE